MAETKENFLTKFINEKLIPFSTAFAQNKYVKSIGGGSMCLMTIIMLESSLQSSEFDSD